jgi:thiol-disulfide isomerase/thioredoxin
MKRNRIFGLLLIPLFAIVLLACDSGGASVSSTNTNPATTSSAGNTVARAGSNVASSIAPAAKPQWIMFSTTWCTICKGMRPTINAVKTEYQARVSFVEYDREDPANAAIVKKYNVTVQPIFIFLDKSGTMTQEIIGATDAATLKAALDKASQ